MTKSAHLLALACLTLALLAWPLRASSDAASNIAIDLLAQQNGLRYAIGAPTITSDPRLIVAAQNHADYSALNHTGGHYETAGQPGYTGYAPRDRVAAAGWSPSFVSEVAAGYSGASNALNELWHAPYHRLGMMHPNNVSSGWGNSTAGGGSATVGDFVYDFSVRPVDFVRSPAASQTGIPASWSGNESPSPLPSGIRGPVGYPIMVVYSAGQNVTMRAAEIVAPNGSRVPIYYAPQQFEYDYQVIIPQQPLAAGTTYHVRFDINVNSRMVTNEWDFTTAGAGGSSSTPPAYKPPVPADAGYHSRWLSESPFPTLKAGEVSAPLTISFTNTGSKSWVRGVEGQQANLGVNGDNRQWAPLGIGWPTPDRVAIQKEAIVAPGQVGSFTFQVRAPSAPGTYAIDLRGVIDGTVWLEDEGVFLYITVR
ncbi:MAG: hypothetical protein HY071_06785 [Chloroflexi bacterium]|nr:hypothetical protein [Chloroflexota bacterium]